MNKYITKGFDDFSKGTFENGGQNLYVSKDGVLQRIFQYDVNQDGYPELIFANSQSMHERPPIYVYNALPHDTSNIELPSNGTYEGLTEDLFNTGFKDLVIACQHNGTHTDITAIIYFGSADGYSENYRAELPVPCSISVCAGDFNGNGRKDLAFVSENIIRVFYQEPSGFNPAHFTDYPVGALRLAAADFDGDGYSDLVFKNAKNQVGIVWGSSNGLDFEHILWLNTKEDDVSLAAGGSTAGVLPSSSGWRPCVVTFNGNRYLFIAEDDYAVFYTLDHSRTCREAFRLSCPGVVAATAGDLTNNGIDDLVLTVFGSRDTEAPCRVYLGNGAPLPQDYIEIPIKGAVSATILQLDGPALVFSRVGESREQEVPTPIVRVHPNGSYTELASIHCGDCMDILAGTPNLTSGNDRVVVLNHKMNRLLGEEQATIYLGNADGYSPDRKLTLTGHSCVDSAMVDFFDRGTVDVLLCNCFEDDPYNNDGAYIYLNGPDGLCDDRKVKLPTLYAHGAAIGDFRKSGYLDIAVGGILNRELRIFHGSKDGYSLDNCTRIVLGPDPDKYDPESFRNGIEYPAHATAEERRIGDEYGQVRWLLAADFNNDGWLDIFVSEILGSRCFILWGGPDGFSTKNMTELMTDGVASATVADLNHNGWPDLILGQHHSLKKNTKRESYITVYWGGPDGYQENRKMQLPASCANSVTVGDYNGNGSFDIYATSYSNGRTRDLLSYLYKGDDGKFSTSRVQYLFNHSGCGCVSGDFNGDGYTDLAVACHKEYGNHESHSFIFWGGPDGLIEDRKTVLPTCGPHGMSTIDPGNIMDRGDREHYTSEVIALPNSTKVYSISWEGICTSTSWVELELRSAPNPEALKNANWVSVPAGQSIEHLGLHGYVQYRIALCAKCSCGTPRITSVTLIYQ